MSYNYKKPKNIFDIRHSGSHVSNSYELLLGDKKIATILCSSQRQFDHFRRLVNKANFQSKK